MKVLILNCDLDKVKATNGGELLRTYLARLGHKAVIKNVCHSRFPRKNELSEYEKVFITGSIASVYEKRPWIPRLSGIVEHLHELNIPTFCICFGHQLVAQTFGGKVAKGNEFVEGFKTISLTERGRSEPVFENFESQFKVYQSHGDVVTKLPKKSQILAKSKAVTEAYSFDNFICVQFHPEIYYNIALKMAIRDKKAIKPILNNVVRGYSLPAMLMKNFMEAK